MSHPEYDPALLVQWLWFKHRCFTASGEEFQALFEDIIRRVEPGFMSIRAYGNIGDRKCDGWLEDSGVVFQVYSPDVLKQSALRSKINEDLDGAVAQWRERGMTKWVFVYNVRKGVPPDVPGMLQEQREKYPDLTIDSMASDDLWTMLAGLPMQQRCEVLGPPVGQMFSETSANGENGPLPEDSAIVLVHDVLSPIDTTTAQQAIAPSVALGPPYSIRPTFDGADWDSAASEQAAHLRELMERAESLRPRFCLFAMSPIPLLVHAGFVLSDRVAVRCYQYDRDARRWTWADDRAEASGPLEVSGLPTARTTVRDVVVRVSLSARVQSEDLEGLSLQDAHDIEIAAPEPNVRWLRAPADLDNLRDAFAQVMNAIRRHTRVDRIHVLYAGPAAGAVTVGQAFNPRMDPPVVTYEYGRQTEPCYQPAITLHS